nr:hypothetical protein [Thermaceae bacterium]
LCNSYTPLVHQHDAGLWAVPSANEEGRFYSTTFDILAGRWSCDCRWGASLNTSSRCWHADLAAIFEQYGSQLNASGSVASEDYTDICLRFLRTINGSLDDQIHILERARTQALVGDNSRLYGRIVRVIQKWYAATTQPTPIEVFTR